jgi:predicted secreted protein
LNDLELHGNELDVKLSQNSEETTLDSPSVERETKRRKTERQQSESTDCKNKRPEESELWTEKYQFKSENDIVTNNSQLVCMTKKSLFTFVIFDYLSPESCKKLTYMTLTKTY